MIYCAGRSAGLRTVFKDESDSGDGLAADKHDGIVSGGLGEGLGLAVGVEDEAAAFVQQLLIVQRDAGPAGEQLLEQRRPVDTRGQLLIGGRRHQSFVSHCEFSTVKIFYMQFFIKWYWCVSTSDGPIKRNTSYTEDALCVQVHPVFRQWRH